MSIVIAENVKFKKWNCDVLLDKYAADSSDALVLVDHETSERVAVATSCLAGMGVIVPAEHAAIKDYSENEGMLNALIDAGIVELTNEMVSSGFAKFPIVRIVKRVDVDEVAA